RALGQARRVRRAQGRGRGARLRRCHERAAGALVLPRRTTLRAGDRRPRLRTSQSRGRRGANYPCAMATSSGSGKAGKAGKPTRADKKLLRTAKREKRRESLRNIGQAFTLTRQADPRFVPIMAMAAVAAAAVAYVLVFLVTGSA